MKNATASVPSSAPGGTGARWRVGRATLAVGLLVVAVANGLAPGAAEAVGKAGVAGAAILLFGADPLVLVSALAGLWLVGGGGAGKGADGRDALAATATAALLLIPHEAAGWVAGGVLGAYGMIAWRRDVPLAAGAAIFFVLSVHEVWAGRVLMNLLAPALTEADAALATGLLRLLGQEVSRQGNVIVTPNGYELVVVTLCTTFRAFWYGFLCCFAFTRLVRPAWRWTELRTWAVLALAVLLLNVVRLTLFGLDLFYYDALHGGAGGTLFNLAVLIMTLGIAAHGVRHELRLGRPDR